MIKKVKRLIAAPQFVSKQIIVVFLFAAIAPFTYFAVFASAVNYSNDSCSIAFQAGSAAADGVLEPGQTFPASFSVYNGSPIVSGSSQELWPDNSGPTPASTRYKLVPSTGNNYDTTWTGGNAANNAPYTVELFGGTNSSYGYLIGNVAGVDARTGLGNGTYVAPNTPGTYTFKFQLKQAGGSWHPTVICSKSLQVKATGPQPSSTPQPTTTPQPPSQRVNPYVCNQPYPAVLKLGSSNSSGGRSDECVTAIQYSFQASTPGFTAPALTGTVNSETVTFIRNFQQFFGGSNPNVTGQLTASEIAGVVRVFGPFKTSGPQNSNSPTPQPSQQPGHRDPNPYVCNKPFPTIKSGYLDKSGRDDKCVSAVQYNLQAAAPTLKVSGITDAPTVTAIKNFQVFFGKPSTGELTPDQVEGIATIFGAYKTSSTGGGDDGGGGSGKKLHVTIAGANFGTDKDSQNLFKSIAKQSIKTISETPPYSTNSSSIVYHMVDIGSIPCAPLGNTGDGRDWQCDYTAAANALAATGVPYDKAVILNNSNVWGGTAGVDGQFATANLSDFIVLHEFSHTMGLLDEYSYSAGSAGPTAGSEAKNCNGGPDNKYWTPGDPFYAGCTYGSWNRAAADSIMFSASSRTFTAPAIRVLEETIKSFTK